MLSLRSLSSFYVRRKRFNIFQKFFKSFYVSVNLNIRDKNEFMNIFARRLSLRVTLLVAASRNEKKAR